MSDGQLGIEFYAEATNLIKEQAKLLKQQSDQIDNYKKLAAESKKSGKDAEKAAKDAEKAAAAAARELDRFAAATTKINHTPLEKYTEEMKQLDSALKAGKISQDTYTRAVDRSKLALEQTKLPLQQVAVAGKQTFGESAVASLKAYATGMIGLATATGIFRDVMAMAREDTAKVKADYEALIEQRRNLLQIAEPGKFDEVTGRADELAVTYGLLRPDAYDLLTAAKNEGFEPSVDYIARAASANLVTPAAASSVAGQVPALFPKTPITPQQALNMNLAAAGSSRLSFEGIAAGLPIAAEGMSMLGSTPAESMAVMGVLSSRFRSGETAGERAALLAGKMTNDVQGRFAGKGLMAGVDTLAAMPEGQRREFLKDDKETNAAYAILVEERAKIQQRLQEVNTAKQMSESDDSLVAIGERQAFDKSTLQGRNWSAFVDLRKAQARRQISGEQGAAYAYRTQTVIEDYSADMERRKVNPLGRWKARTAMGWGESMGVPDALVKAMGRAGEGGLSLLTSPGAFGDAVRDFKEATRYLTGAAYAQQQAAENLERNTSNASAQRASAARQPE